MTRRRTISSPPGRASDSQFAYRGDSERIIADASAGPSLFALLYKIADSYIFIVTEYTKTLVREIWLLIGQIINIFTNLFMHFFYKPGHYGTTAQHKPAMSLKLKSVRSPTKQSFRVDRRQSFVFPTPNNELAAPPVGNRLAGIVGAVIKSHQKKKKTKDRAAAVGPHRTTSHDNMQIEEDELFEEDDDSFDESPVVEDEEEEEEEEEEDEDVLSSPQQTPTRQPNGGISYHVGLLFNMFDRVRDFIISIFMWNVMIVTYIPSLFRAPTVSGKSGIINDRVHLYEKKGTGLIQDLQYATMTCLDDIACAMRLLVRCKLVLACKKLFNAVCLFLPSKFLSVEGIDDRSTGQVITDEGYPYEQHACITKDGYVLTMDRIANHQSRNIVYFQHGILDSGYAWVGNGVSHSLAFRAYSECDADVYLGNFRGNGLTPGYLATKNKVPARKFWDYSFDEHAFYDVRAFLEKIVQLKDQELKGQKYNITVIAHSMGAGSILAYLVHSKLTNQPHHIDRTILLSPAGSHTAMPKLLYFSSFLIEPTYRYLPIYYLGLTSKTTKILVSKLVQDINNHPATRSLFSSVASRFLLGGQSNNNPFQYVHNLVYHTFNGTSVKVLVHLMQMNRSKHFQSFDYGAEENMNKYGTKTPIKFMDHYDLIDIPVHIVYGDDDRVIPKEDVTRHYNALHKFHPSRTYLKRFENVGHLELTMGSNTEIIRYCMRVLRRQANKL